MDTTLEVGGVPGARTAQDACATLIELARALKGWLFYGPDDPARRDLVDRAWRVIQAEAQRSGPLALEVRRGAFWLAGTEAAVGVGRIDELARRLYERAVSRLVFEPEADPASIAAFLDVVAAAPGPVADAARVHRPAADRAGRAACARSARRARSCGAAACDRAARAAAPRRSGRTPARPRRVRR
jgi:acyl CoA:acetate/3-ketoacid CoA transferase alpha subunit